MGLGGSKQVAGSTSLLVVSCCLNEYCLSAVGTSQLKYYRANKLVTPEEAFGERAKDVDFKPKRTLEEELDVLKEKVLHIL